MGSAHQKSASPVPSAKKRICRFAQTSLGSFYARKISERASAGFAAAVHQGAGSGATGKPGLRHDADLPDTGKGTGILSRPPDVAVGAGQKGRRGVHGILQENDERSRCLAADCQGQIGVEPQSRRGHGHCRAGAECRPAQLLCPPHYCGCGAGAGIAPDRRDVAGEHGAAFAQGQVADD